MYHHDYILIFLIDDIEIYTVGVIEANDTEGKITVIADKYNGKVGVYIVNETTIVEGDNIETVGNDIDKTIRLYIKDRYRVVSFLRHPILEKVRLLAAGVSLCFLIRHRNLTRGGEYIELAYLLGTNTLDPSKVFFMKKEGFDLSQMALEILDQYGITTRSYRDDKALYDQATRTTKYFLGSKS